MNKRQCEVLLTATKIDRTRLYVKRIQNKVHITFDHYGGSTQLINMENTLFVNVLVVDAVIPSLGNLDIKCALLP